MGCECEGVWGMCKGCECGGVSVGVKQRRGQCECGGGKVIKD